MADAMAKARARQMERRTTAAAACVAALYDVEWAGGMTIMSPAGELYFDAQAAKSLWQGLFVTALERTATPRAEAIHG